MGKRDDKFRPALPDWHLWAEVTATVRPLPPRRPSLLRLADTPLPLPETEDEPKRSRPLRGLPAYRASTPIADAPGHQLEPRLRRRLTRGQLGIEGTIDLHGMRQAEAHAALIRFLEARARRGDRTLLVITGKGGPAGEAGFGTGGRGVLRAMLPTWLADPRLAPLIAGWEPAARQHGGDGAFYVRLRRGDRS